MSNTIKIADLHISCNRTLEEACSEVQREINVRRKCFDRWVAEGRITDTDARDRFERLTSSWHYLKRCLDGEAPADPA